MVVYIAGMVFNVSIGFQGLINKAGKDSAKKYSLFIGDTVLVGEVSLFSNC